MKPARLVKGKLIDSIPGVVETWDWFINQINGIKGDGSTIKVSHENGKITISAIKSDGDGGGSGTDDDLPDIPPIPTLPPFDISGLLNRSGTAAPTCYKVQGITDSSTVGFRKIMFSNPYYGVGGKTYTGPTSIDVTFPCLVALKLSATSTASSSLESYGSLASLQAEQADTDYYVLPLCQFDSSENVVCDFTSCPTAAMGEL